MSSQPIYRLYLLSDDQWLTICVIELSLKERGIGISGEQFNICNRENLDREQKENNFNYSFKSSIETCNTNKMKSSVDPFLDFLDNNFKPEFKLDETPSLFIDNKSVSKVIESNIVQENVTVKQKYKGNKSDIEKGAYSERRDILHKNLIRSIRRYFWNQFSSEYDARSFGKKKHSEIYEKSVKIFYQNFLKSKTEIGHTLNEEEDAKVCFWFSVIVSTNFYYTNLDFEQNKFVNLFKTLTKKYSVRNYHKFLWIKEVKILMKMLNESKIIEDILEEYGCLSSSREIYAKAFEDVLNFSGEIPFNRK